MPKKMLALLLSLLMAATFVACAADTKAVKEPAAEASEEVEAPEADAPEMEASETDAPVEEPVELVIFAAASLTEALTAIGETYTEEHANVKLTFTFDSSGTLKTQIEEGAVCDLFLSAAPKQMNALDATKGADANPTGLDMILSDTRIDLLENKVVLVVPAGNPKNIQSFDELIAALQTGDILLAMGNADVPVGQYTQKIFAFYGLEEAALASAGVLSYGSNVKEVVTQVSEGAVDCGIVYATDAASAGLTVADTATAEMCGQVIYPAAILKATLHQQAAQAFLDYLSGDAAAAVFASVGFSMMH